MPVTGPLARLGRLQPGDAARQRARTFPASGWLVGAVGAARVRARRRPAAGVAGALAAALSTVATVLLTGAFHEDGLADVADGLGGSADRERALRS